MNLRAFAVGLMLASAIADAQQPSGDVVAFNALRASELGVLTPLMTPSMVHRKLNGVQFALRYGVRDSSNIVTSSVAGSAIFSIGMRASMAVTAGVRNLACEAGCEPEGLAGAVGDLRVYEIGDVINKGSALSLGLSGSVGFAQLSKNNTFVGNNAVVAGVGAPIAASFSSGGKEGLRFVPYFTPVFGYGYISSPCPAVTPCPENGTRWILGGGVGVWNPMSRLAASIGISQVVFEGATPLYGVSVMYGGR